LFGSVKTVTDEQTSHLFRILMRHSCLLLILLLGGLLSLSGYYLAWIDWLDDIQTGVYARHRLEAFWETSALIIYTYLAVRFANSKLPRF
jgi:hypothetical protein